jgi:hypothetical protein
MLKLIKINSDKQQHSPIRQQMLESDTLPRINLNKYVLCDTNGFPWCLCCIALDNNSTGCSCCEGLIAIEKQTQHRNQWLYNCCGCCSCYKYIFDCECCACDFNKCKPKWRSGQCMTVFKKCHLRCFECFCYTVPHGDTLNPNH